MKRRQIIRIISFLAALLLIVSIFLVKAYIDNKNYKDQIKYTYSRSFEILNSSLNNIAVNLKKASYVTTPLQLSEISTEIFSETVIAKQALAEFPSGEAQFDTVNKFLSQVGNYVTYLTREVISGGEIADEDNENLEKLLEISQSITDAVTTMGNKYNNSGYWDSEIIGETDELENGTLADNFLDLEETLTDYPTLLYDGPYSDHKLTQNAKMLHGRGEVSEALARQNVEKLLQNDYEIEFKEVSQGKIPAYEFVFENGYASVSLDGGFVLSFRKFTEETMATLSYEQAVGIAKKFLSNNFEDNFSASYYYTDNGVCVINFACLQDNVICYADLIKVGVDLSNGEVVLYEAGGYISNHTLRQLQEPAYTYDEAKNIISDNLKIKSYASAMIPTDGGYEELCYEFLCTGKNDEEILLYINADTLQEEQIFILLKTDGGTLVK